MTATAEPVIRCRRCRRPLHTSTARALGVGARCAAIEAALAGLDSRQQEKALEAIADRAVIRTSRPGIANVVSEDGAEVHVTSAAGNCTCAYGVRRMSAVTKTCWHVGAVRLDMASRLTASRTLFVLAA